MQIENNMQNDDLIKGNSPELMEVLRSAELVAVTDVAVMITGEGRAFCSGGDIRQMQSEADAEGRPALAGAAGIDVTVNGLGDRAGNASLEQVAVLPLQATA